MQSQLYLYVLRRVSSSQFFSDSLLIARLSQCEPTRYAAKRYEEQYGVQRTD